MIRLLIISLVFSVIQDLGCVANAQSLAVPEAECSEAMSQWQSLKYGMFIHFGMNTFTATELDPGDKPSTTYAPTDLDVDQWIRVARDAGMKYAVLTAKHTSGHCLWDSKVTWKGKEFDYDVATSGNKTDVVAEFFAACKRHDIRPGLYYCLLDPRHNVMSRNNQWFGGWLSEDFFELAKSQVGELLENNPDLFYLWMDIPRAASLAQRRELYDHFKKINPNCIVLFSYGIWTIDGAVTINKFHDAVWPTDIINTERTILGADQYNPQQTWQGNDHYLGYEHCDTICKKWFWVPEDTNKTTENLLDLYTRTTAVGGNLLLNVPPNKKGQMPEGHIRSLLELKEAIEASSASDDNLTR